MDRLIPKIESQTGERISKGKIIEILNSSSIDFEAFYSQSIEKYRKNQRLDQGNDPEAPKPQKDFIVGSFDGKGIPLRRQKNSGEKCIEESKSEKKPVLKSRCGKKKMATVASVHDSTFFPRTPIEVHKTLLGEIRGVSKIRPKPIGKRVWASLSKPALNVFREGFEEVLLRDPTKKKTLVVVIDGAEYQKEKVLEECKKSGRKYEVIIDIIHAIEYLWKAAKVFFPTDKACQAEWVRGKQFRLLEGGAKGIAKGLRARASKENLQGDALEVVKTSAGYFSKNLKYMRYQVFLEKGYPIGSGVIEGACRNLIGDRLEITGAHWSVEGAESMLKLRALVLNGDFEDYWKFHIEQELERRNRQDFSKKSRQILIEKGEELELPTI